MPHCDGLRQTRGAYGPQWQRQDIPADGTGRAGPLWVEDGVNWRVNGQRPSRWRDRAPPSTTLLSPRPPISSIRGPSLIHTLNDVLSPRSQAFPKPNRSSYLRGTAFQAVEARKSPSMIEGWNTAVSAKLQAVAGPLPCAST